jgi:Lipocalin-like domain
VLIAHGGRTPFANRRLAATDAETLHAARTFTAYAGTFDVKGHRIVHHVEMNSYPNDVGVDYPRVARIDGDVLELATPPELPPGQRPMRLSWRRIGGQKVASGGRSVKRA